MNRAPEPHPCLPVPLRHRRTMMLAIHMALAELGDTEQAQVDLQAAAAVVRELLQHYVCDGAAEAAETALGALQRLREGHGTADEARRACAAMAAHFEALLTAVTLRRLQDAQLAAGRRLQDEAASIP